MPPLQEPDGLPGGRAALPADSLSDGRNQSFSVPAGTRSMTTSPKVKVARSKRVGSAKLFYRWHNSRLHGTREGTAAKRDQGLGCGDFEI